jgi:mono/diheme cytochrome c family protein
MRADRIVLIVLAVLGLLTPAHAADPPGLGRSPTEQEVAAMDIDIAPNGTGLPSGRGSSAQGAPIFAEKCAACHGLQGELGDDAPTPKLAGGRGSLPTGKPLQTVGSYWPYATTLFDYVRRAMPLNAPQTLDSDQVYALTAYILHINGLVSEDASMNAKTLPAIVMPNRNGFFRTPNQPGR